jgi:Tn3 transposase DDE domain
MTNAVIFHTTLDMMTVIRELIAEGWQITPADLAVLSPYVTARIQRFGVYATDEIAPDPRTLQRGHRPGRRILNSPDPAPASGTARGGYWAYLGCTRLTVYPLEISSVLPGSLLRPAGQGYSEAASSHYGWARRVLGAPAMTEPAEKIPMTSPSAGPAGGL